MHLPGQADAGDVGAGRARGREGGPDRRLRAVPPQGWVLLAPARSRCRERVAGGPGPADHAPLVDEDRLGGGRRDVDPQDEARHRQPPLPVVQTARLTVFS